MERRSIAALKDLVVESGGAEVSFNVVDNAGRSDGYTASIGTLNRIIVALQDLCKNAITRLQERPGFDESNYSVPFVLESARTLTTRDRTGDLRIVVQMKASTGLVIDVALPKPQALQLAAQIAAQAKAPDPISTKLS